MREWDAHYLDGNQNFKDILEREHMHFPLYFFP